MNRRTQDRRNTLTDQPDTGEPDFAVLSDRVYRLCLALLRHGDSADDAAQEALTRAWDFRRKKRSSVSWWTWSAGFAVRVCREFRRRRRWHVDLTDSAAVSVTTQNPSPSLAPDDAAVLAVIHSLPRRQREITVLRFLSGQSVKEVATTLGCSEGTVKSGLHKAIGNLRRKLDAGDGQWAAAMSKNC
jgi:RNA polymerase sigma factor (sigma-70 family)